MAAVHGLLTCPICDKWFDKPKRLPCGHVFCCEDLQYLVKEETGKLHCIHCTGVHDVPNGDVEQFPLDDRLMEFINLEAMKRGKCKLCLSDKNVSNCDHCNQDLCEDHLEEHKLTFEGLMHRVKDTIETKQKKIHERREKNDQEKSKINEESDALIMAVEKRRETLMLPFARENTILDKLQTDIDQLANAENFIQEIRNEMDETDCKMTRMKNLQIKINEMKNELEETVKHVNQKENIPRGVVFDYQRDDLQKMIADYGQKIVDHKNMKRMRTVKKDADGVKFNHVFGLGVCPVTDHVYLTSCISKSINELDEGGNPIRSMKTDYSLYGVAIDSKQRIILPGFNRTKVCIYDKKFNLIRSFGRHGSGDGEFNFPSDAACDEEDNIYVLDKRNHRIQVFTSDGEFIRKFGEKVLLNPNCMAITKNKRIIVTDFNQNKVFVFTLEGELETNIHIYQPTGICQDINGYIMVADHWNRTIHVLTPELEKVSIIKCKGKFQDMYGITFTKSGCLFVTDQGGNKVHILK